MMEKGEKEEKEEKGGKERRRGEGASEAMSI
jgi:hypothetical protein